jgi:hypothetical protein
MNNQLYVEYDWTPIMDNTTSINDQVKLVTTAINEMASRNIPSTKLKHNQGDPDWYSSNPRLRILIKKRNQKCEKYHTTLQDEPDNRQKTTKAYGNYKPARSLTTTAIKQARQHDIDKKIEELIDPETNSKKVHRILRNSIRHKPQHSSVPPIINPETNIITDVEGETFA